MIAHMKDAHDGMSDSFRAMLESPGYSIYYHAPTVIMVIGKTGSRSGRSTAPSAQRT